VAILLALVTAATFGVGDFCGGLAARRVTAVQVVAGAHVIGAVGALIAAVAFAERWDTGDAVLGMLGGAFGMVGVILLYRRLAAGPMSVVAPLTGVTSAGFPAIWGLAGGERLTGPGWLGLLIGLLAVVLVSLGPEGPSGGGDQPVTARVVGESLGAGLGFGAIFVFFDATSAESAPWPVASGRVLTSTLLVGFLLLRARRPGRGGGDVIPRSGPVLVLIALAGLADTLANVTFLAATAFGRLAVVSVLSSLYPISTVVLARVVLSERMTRPQVIGFASALTATALLTAG
jgi:drug/metabolite transporter (DMT)-like permease